MKKVITKKELEAAIKAGETDLLVDNKKLLYAILLASKYKSSKKIFHEWLSQKMIKSGTMNVAITPTVVIVITITAAITAIAIVAMFKKYHLDGELTYDPETGLPTGKLKLHPQAA